MSCRAATGEADRSPVVLAASVGSDGDPETLVPREHRGARGHHLASRGEFERSVVARCRPQQRPLPPLLASYSRRWPMRYGHRTSGSTLPIGSILRHRVLMALPRGRERTHSA